MTHFFQSINQCLLNRSESFVSEWLPDGKRSGSEWMARNPTRDDQNKGSFNINLDTGLWKDFSSGDGGADFISLYAYLNNLGQFDSAKELNDRYRFNIDATKESQPAKVKPKPKKEPFNSYVWDNAKPANEDHPYLKRKKVKCFGLRQFENDLIIPIYNIDSNALQGIQRISPDGQKKNHGEVSKGYFEIGNRKGKTFIAEGYADIASILECTGYHCVMTFGANGLVDVAKSVKSKANQNDEIIIVADNEPNGIAKAKEAAKAINALYVMPNTGIKDKKGNEDINDVFCKQGMDAVAELLEKAKHIEINNDSTESVLLLSAASIKPRAISWLWEGWLSPGKLHLLAGAPGTAKTTIALTWAAIISNGGIFPDGTQSKQGNVLIWSSEDDPNDTLIPRLIAAGANRQNVHIVNAVNNGKNGKRSFDPSKDFPLLKKAVNKIGSVTFMIIDSVADAVAGDSAKNNQVRRALSPIKEFAEEMNIAVLGITHFNKGTNGRAMSRIIDSVAFVGLPRVVMVAFKKKGNGSLLMRAKSNIGPDTGGYGYYTYVEPLPLSSEWDAGITANRVCFQDFVEGSADEHLQEAESPYEDSEKVKDRAEEFLLDQLSDGMRKPSSEIEANAVKAGISPSAIKKAKVALRIKSKKINDRWYVYPPTSNNEESSSGGGKDGSGYDDLPSFD